MSETLTMEQRLTRWALSGDTGASSETLACAVLGLPDTSRRFGFDVPRDFSDFGRCYRLVQIVPEILTMWDKVRAACPAWGPIIDNWDALVARYQADSLTNDTDTCRALLQELADVYLRSKMPQPSGSGEGTWRNP